MKKIITLIGIVGIAAFLWYGNGCTKADAPGNLTEEAVVAEEVVPMLEVPAPEEVAPEAEKIAPESEEKK